MRDRIIRPAAWGGVPAQDAGPVCFIEVARMHPQFGTILDRGTGTLIMNRWVLTAAHVTTSKVRGFEDDSLQYATVILGDADRTRAPYQANAVNNKILYHDMYEEDYDGRLRNDLSMIPLDPRIGNGVESARIVALPRVGDIVTFKGWGALGTDEHGSPIDFPDVLHEGDLIVAESHPAMMTLKSMDEGDANRVVSVMDGDSGGGIFNQNGELVAVTSHRMQKPHELMGPQTGAESGAVPVAPYIRWIEGIVNDPNVLSDNVSSPLVA